MTVEYDDLADVYEWLTPESLLEPAGAVEAFEQVLEAVPAGGRVLDCAAGTGQLAVGLALRGYETVGTDISDRMLRRTRALVRQHHVAVRAEVCSWDALDQLGLDRFDAVFCVGNSLAHARGGAGRRSALTSMRSQLRTGGVLAVTSRNWELVRASGSGLRLPSELVVRRGISGVVVYRWSVPDSWELRHSLDIAVVLLDGDIVSPHVRRLTFWPFTHGQLHEELKACGLAPQATTYEAAAERYLVTATAA